MPYNSGLSLISQSEEAGLESARAYIEWVAEQLDAGQEHGLATEGAVAKYMATEAGNRAAEDAIQALGGYGYTREYLVEKIKRDVRITCIHEGTSEIMDGPRRPRSLPSASRPSSLRRSRWVRPRAKRWPAFTRAKRPSRWRPTAWRWQSAPGRQDLGQPVPVTVDGQTVSVLLPDADKPVDEMEWLLIDGRPYELAFDRDLRWVKAFSGIHPLELRDLEAGVGRPTSRDGRVKDPIPGLNARVLVAPGQRVEAGQPLLVLEAMKMENEIRAPRAGLVSAVHVSAGRSVALGQLLAEID